MVNILWVISTKIWCAFVFNHSHICKYFVVHLLTYIIQILYIQIFTMYLFASIHLHCAYHWTSIISSCHRPSGRKITPWISCLLGVCCRLLPKSCRDHWGVAPLRREKNGWWMMNINEVPLKAHCVSHSETCCYQQPVAPHATGEVHLQREWDIKWHQVSGPTRSTVFAPGTSSMVQQRSTETPGWVIMV